MIERQQSEGCDTPEPQPNFVEFCGHELFLLCVVRDAAAQPIVRRMVDYHHFGMDHLGHEPPARSCRACEYP